jgi:hypothetical protein
MLGTRAFGHMTLGEDALAAEWADRAARSPGAHVLIAMIATAANALAGNDGPATSWAANVRERNPLLSHEDFFRAFPMQRADARARVEQSLIRCGF